MELLIAGIAYSNNETLITKDRDFLKFEDKRIVVLNIALFLNYSSRSPF